MDTTTLIADPRPAPSPTSIARQMGYGLRASAAAVQAVVPHEVFLAVQVAGPVAAWALVDGGSDDDGSRLVNWGLAVSALTDSVSGQFRYISAEVARLYPTLQAMAERLPAGHQVGVGFAGPGGALGGLGALMRTDDSMSFMSSVAGTRLKALGDEANARCAELLRMSGASHLVVATDGSVGRGQRGAGAGWVDSWGGFGCTRVDTANILVAELEAIAHALEHVPRSATCVTVRSDSTAAIAVAVQALRLGPTAGPVRIPAQAHRAANRIHAAGRRVTVKVEWVRAHQGDPMNETADRLAVLARRAIRAGLAPGAVGHTAAGIVTDHLSGMDRPAVAA